MQSYKLLGIFLVLFLFGVSSVSRAEESEHYNEPCPVGLVSGMTLSVEFGQAVADNTRCIKKRHDVKTMFAIDEYVTDPANPDTAGRALCA